jgi:hypothetical protein
MPDSVEGRLLQVEEKTARLGQRVEDIAQSVGQVVPLIRELGEVAVELRAVNKDVLECRDEIATVRRSLEDRDQQATDERRAVRIALIALTGVIFAALIAAVATIVAASIA